MAGSNYCASSGASSGTFSAAEYEQRLQRVRQRMSELGLDTLITSNPAHLNYLTGYDGWSFYVHQCVIVSLQLTQPVCGYADDYVQSTARHPMDFVAGLMASRGIDGGHIGVEKDSYYFTGGCLEHLRDGLPNATLHDATTLVAWIRVIKSDAELAMMRDAARIIDKTMVMAIDTIHPGMRQCDLAAAILSSQVTGMADAGGDYPAIMPMLPSGPGTSTPHLTWTDAPFKSGEASIFELAGVRRRYHCPMSRTVHLGAPPRKLADTAKVVGQTGSSLRTSRGGLARRHRPSRYRQGLTPGLLLRPGLSARLG